jgi:hypothetical protein
MVAVSVAGVKKGDENKLAGLVCVLLWRETSYVDVIRVGSERSIAARKGPVAMVLLILLIVLILIFAGGGYYGGSASWGRPYYRSGGVSLGGILLVILILGLLLHWF